VALAARIDVFDDLLGASTPEGERDALLAVIEASRQALESHPSSCANRERRERAFDALYPLMETHWGWSRLETDRAYRTLADHVFPELAYTASPSCCWNTSTPAMYEVILDHAALELADADAAGTCVEPTPFVRTNAGYAPFEAHAASLGLPWGTWAADEDCPQAGNDDDVVIQAPHTDWCDLEEPEVPVDPPTPTPVPEDEQHGGCGCNDARLNGVWTTMMVGLVIGWKREPRHDR